jgi:putative tryptophan/tyrosine transport system substrate-binding protein
VEENLRRREFVSLLAGATAWPLAARAAKPPRIGLLSGAADPARPVGWFPFFERMGELGYVEGRTIAYERRFGAGKSEQVDDFAADLVRRNVDVIVVAGEREASAAKRATSAIPIVMIYVADPVATGLVASLARPGGNITGLASRALELDVKRLDLLKETVPGLAKVAVLINPDLHELYAPDSPWTSGMKVAARSIGIELAFYGARQQQDLEPAFAAIQRNGAHGAIVVQAAQFFAFRRQIADLALKYRLPAIFWHREQVREGGLMLYAASTTDLPRRAAEYVDRILKGARPADLPIEQPTKFELVINLTTAKAIGLTIPPALIARADEVIE